ncbi:MAG: hypothetical protein C5S48_02375 [Candidatus Methanogaster sp.]|nr:MAG: hypothetical protein C5S48_02375 [ANME-2 cluster archaeon]
MRTGSGTANRIWCDVFNIIIHIYLDESGDLGFSERSSKYLVIAVIVTTKPYEIERCVKNTRNRKLKKAMRTIPEIKFYRTNIEIRMYLLKCLSKTDAEIAYIVLEKAQVYDNLRHHKDRLYNYVIGFLLRRYFFRLKDEQITLIVDKHHQNRQIIENFNKYIPYKTDSANKNIDLQIAHADSQRDKCLQATDFVAGAIFQKYEHGDDTYYHQIEEMIVRREKMFK